MAKAPIFSDQDQTRMAMAALFAALIEVLREQDKSAPSKADEALRRLYEKIKHWESDPIHVLETLKWAGEMVRELND